MSMPNPSKAERKRERRRQRIAMATLRSLENPKSLTDPDDELFDMLGASRTSSGVRVTQKKAIGYPSLWRAVNLISGDVGKLPMMVYRMTGEGDAREAAKDHPAYRLLRRKPNDAMTAFVFKQTITFHLLLQGNGYAYIDRDGGGTPLSLLLLDPNKVTPMRVGGEIWYVYETPSGELRRVIGTDILHYKGLGFDGLEGYSVLSVMADSVGVALAARDHSGRYFKNGTRPGGVLKHPGKLTPAARVNMRESWERIHKGLENSHKIAILEEGTDYTSFTVNAKDAQLLESRAFDAREMANIFGVPAHKLGDSSKVAYNSLGEENQSYYDDTLSRWLALESEEASDKLLSEAEKASESHVVDFDYQEIQRANLAAQSDFAVKGFTNGILNRDECRQIFGKNPIPDGSGKVYYVPVNLGAVGQPAAEPKPATEPDPKPAPAPRGLRAVVVDTLARMVRRLIAHAVKMQGVPTREALESAHGSVMREAFGPMLLAVEDWRIVGEDAGTLARDTIAGVVAARLDGVAVDVIEETLPGRLADKLLGVAA